MRFGIPFFINIAALGLVFIFQPAVGQSMAAENTPSAVKETSERTVATDVETQKAVDAWAAEEKELLEKIDRTERALKRVAWERKKTAEYVETLEDKMVQLREKAEEMKRINAELLPILDQGLENLAAFIESDFPFDKARRLHDVEETAHTLNDYDAGLLAKTRALFDAVAREVDFGYSVDIQETEIEIDGRSTRVKLLRVGRVGIYALTMDAEKAYVWNSGEKKYLPVDGSVREIDEAVQIVERIRIIELTRLPVGQPVRTSNPGGRRHD
jgi:chromosome segregation ATPase